MALQLTPATPAVRARQKRRAVFALLFATACCWAAWYMARDKVHTFQAAAAIARRPHSNDFAQECAARVYASAAHVAEPHACWCSCSAVAGQDMTRFRNRDRAKCPDGSLERHRLLCHLLMTQPYSNVSRILFISPDRSAFEFIISAFPQADVVGGYKHVQGSFVPEASRPMHDVDLTSINFPDAFFDLVIVQHVFEHIEEDARALREVHRILTPGGKGLLEVPITAPAGTIEKVDGVSTRDDRLRVYGQGDHVRRYGRDFYERVRSAGFSVDIVQYKAHFERHVLPSVALHNSELRSKSTMCIATKTAS